MSMFKSIKQSLLQQCFVRLIIVLDLLCVTFLVLSENEGCFMRMMKLYFWDHLKRASTQISCNFGNLLKNPGLLDFFDYYHVLIQQGLVAGWGWVVRRDFLCYAQPVANTHKN